MCLFKGLHVLSGPPAPRHLSLGEVEHAGSSMSEESHCARAGQMTRPS